MFTSNKLTKFSSHLFRRYLPFFISFILVFLLTIFFHFNPEFTSTIYKKTLELNPLNQEKKQVPIPFDQFDFSSELHETNTPENSLSKNWWLNSGGIVYNQNGTISTVQGSLGPENKWFKAYLKSTPEDTDGGSHPQNIFRLVNKNNLQNIRQEAQFKINKTVKSNSPNRNESNGVLFLNRYVDGDNLYYAGIRVDGKAIIKKKKNGIYHTLHHQQIYEGVYNKSSNPNLIPENKWIGLRTEVRNLNFRTVELTVYIDKEANGNWEQMIKAIDDGITFDGSSFINSGHPGIRTDFIDIEFRNYKIEIIQ